MSTKEEIIYLYYTKHMRPKDIAETVGVKPPYITKVIKEDKRYFKEWEKRKQKNAIKNREETKKIIYEQRELKRQLYEIVKAQHIQATQELSHEVKVTTDNNRRCNIVNSDSIRAKHKYFGCRAV